MLIGKCANFLDLHKCVGFIFGLHKSNGLVSRCYVSFLAFISRSFSPLKSFSNLKG